MGYKPTRRTVVTSSALLTAGLAGCMSSSEETDDVGSDDGDDGTGGASGETGSSNNPDLRTVEWKGQGSEHAEQDCPGQFAYWKWVLTPGGQPSIAPDPVPQLTVTYEEQGQLDPVEGELRPGGAGAVHFDVFKEDGDTVESAFVEFSGGGPNALLTISEGFCVDDPEPPNFIDVATLDATAVNGESAVLQGELIDLGPFDSVDLFFRWKHVDDEDFTKIEAEPPTLDEPGTFSATVTGLGPGEYEFQAVAVGENDQEITATGDVFAFEKFEPEQPNFETKVATEVNESTATLNGVVTSLGDFEEIEVFFEWGLLDDEDNWEETDPETVTDADELPYFLSAGIEGLEVGEQYGFRMVVIAGEDRKEGATMTFSKKKDEPDVKTKKPTDVNKSSATLNGKLTDMGGFEYVYVFFQYREAGTEEWWSTEPEKRTDTGSFGETIEGLETGTTYEFRAVVTANDHTVYGKIKQFTKDDHEKKQPDVKNDTSLKAVCYEEKKKDGKTVKFAVENETKHDLKFSWQAKKTDQGGKLTVPKKDKKYFWVDVDEKSLDVTLSFDGKKIHTASTKDAEKPCEKK